MIILASNSPTRAEILRNFGIKFEQICIDYDESKIAPCSPQIYSTAIVEEKSKQFFAKFGDKFDRVLFADSSVFCGGKLLGKAKNENEARNMLNLQSGAQTQVWTAMKFTSKAYNINMLSLSSYKFGKFENDDLEQYLKSNDWQGKAGAMSIEGFNKKYILSSCGNETTTMGLDIINLKAFL